MDGAVMEGPLFLQSQRFGTKVEENLGCALPSQSSRRGAAGIL
uniref:Docking protein 1 n=1 Tax=Mus musculus TaxID=10090 RepID=A0A0N4SW01_MOUSE